MSTDASVKKTSRKGPSRSEESRAAILEATRAELAESGWRTFSVDAVAKRASASKQTIYRWWPSIGAMCVDAALALVPDSPDGGRQLVEGPRKGHAQEQDDKDEQRPEGPAEREQVQPAARGRDFCPDRVQSVLFSQSGTCSSCSISSRSGLRRTMSNLSPLTSTSGTRGRVL